MRWSGPLLAILLVALSMQLVASASALPSGQWYQVEFVNTTFYASVARADLARFVAVARGLDTALDRAGHPFLPRSPSPTHLYVFADAEAYRPYQHRDGGGPAFVDGTHFGRPHAGYVTLNATSPRSERALAHELVHRRLPPGVPRWAEEGLAEVFASVHVADGRLLVGAPDSHHSETLAGTWLPLAELFSAKDLGAPRFRVGHARAAFYAQSWLLVHYWWSDPGRRAELVAALGRGQRPVVPQGPELVEALRRHLDRGPTPIDLGPAPSAPSAPVRGDAMRYADVLFRLGDLLMIQGDRDDEAAEHFQTALGIDSGHGAALGGLAVLADRVGDQATARERFERAVDLDPNDVLLRFRYGRSLLEPVESAHLGDRFDQARRLMHEAFEQAGRPPWLRDAIGRAYLQRLGSLMDGGRLDDARTALEAYRETVPPSDRPSIVDRMAARLARTSEATDSR